ncbi:POT family protein [Dictyocaulus viviparus]|uniref:POT family protein n=1 Tax=Dictyocaulus viviparus TaxID=29172 RepID=A0A0D8YBH3_DICVI|nr:POT family protein [Dictyocaulus viviparus]
MIINYPPTVFLMLGNEFCERFSFYGMKAILTLYFIYEHGYSDSFATFVYHAFTCLAYLSPLAGSILADSYLGRYKVILYGSSIYVLGHILLSFGAVPTIGITIRTLFDFCGLIVIAIATGAIKPCVSAFAADQFSEDQSDLRAQFFSFFYFAINAGSLFAILLTPILRGRVSCFGSQYCFPLAFGVPGVLMVFALLFFLSGWRQYKKCPPSQENVASAVAKCLWLAFTRTLFRRSNKPVSHWLDRAAPEHSPELIQGVRSFVNVAVIFGPLVFFWALFDQQGSTWVLQARRLNGRIGWLTVLPEQINILNPLILFNVTPLRKMAVGGLLTATAFIMAGLLQLEVNKTMESPPPPGRVFLQRIGNASNVHSLQRLSDSKSIIGQCISLLFNVTPLRKMAVGGLLTATAFIMAGLLQLEVNKTMESPPPPGRVFLQKIGNASNVHSLQRLSDSKSIIDDLPVGRTELDAGLYSIEIGNQNLTLNLTIPGKGYVVGLYEDNNTIPWITTFMYATEKTDNGGSRLYLAVPEQNAGKIFVVNHKNKLVASQELSSGNFIDIRPGFFEDSTYTLYYGKNCEVTSCPNKILFKALMGSAKVLHVHSNSSQQDYHELVRPNTVSILWVLPQYFVITLGEVLLSVTGLEFAYSQSAPNMKSVLQALWLLTVFMGNVIDMGISGTHIIPEPAMEFFFYASLMILTMAVFIMLAVQYTYAQDVEHVHALQEKEQMTSDDTDTSC